MGHFSHGFGLFDNARLYDRLSRLFGFRPVYRRVVADVAKAPLPDDAHILDAGTGTGRVPIAIAERHPGLQVEGLDVSKDMIAFARRSAGGDSTATFTIGDVADLPYPDHSFDLVVSTMSQHHWADVQAGMRELSRVLRPGGQLWIYDFRFSLGRAEQAARAAFTAHSFQREPITALVGLLAVKPGLDQQTSWARAAAITGAATLEKPLGSPRFIRQAACRRPEPTTKPPHRTSLKIHMCGKWV